MTASRVCLYLCLSFIAGIFLSSIFKISQPLMLGFLIFGILLISALWQYKKFVVAGFCLLFLVSGIWRHQIAEFRFINDELRKYNDSDKEITLTGIIFGEPEIKGKSQRLTIKIEELTTNNEKNRIAGKILVAANRYPKYQNGDKIKITGKLKSPPVLEGFNYRDYLKKEGIFSVMEWPEIELITGRMPDISNILLVISSDFGNSLTRTLFSFKNKLKESVNSAMSPPQSGLLEALFFGDEENISKKWQEKFNSTGTRHITAVSGMNITIISALLLNFLLLLGFWRSQAFYFSMLLIFLYILMIGAPASAVRAGIMGGLFLTAQYFGRLSLASRTVVFASTFMLDLNPLLLRLDVGFQLSFLAIIGLIYLQPILLDCLKKIPNIFQLRYTIAATLSAQIFTLPILIYNFGRIPIVAPIINVLIVPLLPIITILGFIFSFAGIFWQSLGQILSWPVWFLLSYVTGIVDFFSEIPWTSLVIENAHWVFVAIFYSALGILVRRLQERQKLKFLQY